MNQIASSKLAHTLQKRMKNVNHNDSVVYTDIGTIVADNGLKLDTFEPVIPSDGYSRCRAASEEIGSFLYGPMESRLSLIKLYKEVSHGKSISRRRCGIGRNGNLRR